MWYAEISRVETEAPSMKALFWRAIIAVLCVAFFWLLLPPLFVALGFVASSAVLAVIRICVAAIAVLYVFTGSSPAPPF